MLSADETKAGILCDNRINLFDLSGKNGHVRCMAKHVKSALLVGVATSGRRLIFGHHNSSKQLSFAQKDKSHDIAVDVVGFNFSILEGFFNESDQSVIAISDCGLASKRYLNKKSTDKQKESKNTKPDVLDNVLEKTENCENKNEQNVAMATEMANSKHLETKSNTLDIKMETKQNVSDEESIVVFANGNMQISSVIRDAENGLIWIHGVDRAANSSQLVSIDCVSLDIFNVVELNEISIDIATLAVFGDTITIIDAQRTCLTQISINNLDQFSAIPTNELIDDTDEIIDLKYHRMDIVFLTTSGSIVMLVNNNCVSDDGKLVNACVQNSLCESLAKSCRDNSKQFDTKLNGVKQNGIKNGVRNGNGNGIQNGNGNGNGFKYENGNGIQNGFRNGNGNKIGNGVKNGIKNRNGNLKSKVDYEKLITKKVSQIPEHLLSAVQLDTIKLVNVEEWCEEARDTSDSFDKKEGPDEVRSDTERLTIVTLAICDPVSMLIHVKL